jgi:hypothetical protein
MQNLEEKEIPEDDFLDNEEDYKGNWRDAKEREPLSEEGKELYKLGELAIKLLGLNFTDKTLRNLQTPSYIVHHLENVLEHENISAFYAMNVLQRMRGMFSSKDNEKLLPTIIKRLSEIGEYEERSGKSDKRIKELERMLSEAEKGNNKLKWLASDYHLGFIIKELAKKGFIELPKNERNELLFTEFRNQILGSFSGEINNKTLYDVIYPHNETDLSDNTKKRFQIPHYQDITNNKGRKKKVEN